MIRSPVKRLTVVRSRPCFGTGYDPKDLTCRPAACIQSGACRAKCDPWADRPSLSELAHAERRKLSAESFRDTDGDFRLADLYERLYEKHIGKRHFSRDKVKLVRSMNAVARHCDAHGLDLPMYVAAQMVALRDWSAKQKFGFQPNMMLGPAALGRYNAYVRRTGRRFHHAGEDALADADKAMREALLASETSVGAHLTAVAVNGETPVWSAAMTAADPAPVWWAVAAPSETTAPQAHALRRTLLVKHGKDWMDAALRLARLDAACAVADRYHPCLSDRIGWRAHEPFDWIAFADLMGRMYARPKHADSASPATGTLADFAWVPGG